MFLSLILIVLSIIGLCFLVLAIALAVLIVTARGIMETIHVHIPFRTWFTIDDVRKFRHPRIVIVLMLSVLWKSGRVETREIDGDNLAFDVDSIEAKEFWGDMIFNRKRNDLYEFRLVYKGGRKKKLLERIKNSVTTLWDLPEPQPI